MAVDKLDIPFPPREGRAPMDELEEAIKPYVEKYSLAQTVDRSKNLIKVKRTGFSGELVLDGERIKVVLDYAWLVPGAVRKKITEGVASALQERAKKLGAS